MLELPREVANRDLLREIVRLDFWRILSRLRSTHAKRSIKTINKPALISQLLTAVNTPLRKKGKILSAGRISALQKSVQSIQRSISTLEAMPEISDSLVEAQDILMDIIEHFSKIADNETLAALLDRVSELDPLVKQIQTHLLSAVGKLGRYYFASQDLIREVRSKRYTIFNRILVETCYTGPIPKPHLPGRQSTLQESVEDLIQRERTLRNKRLSMLVRSYLGNSYLAKAENFKYRTSATLAESKVHAEIQLLFFYESYRADLPPRVICSNKSPCYLCHLFFDLHGQFHVPATHGKLYPGWILPTWVAEINDERRRDIGKMIDNLHARLVLRIQKQVKMKRGPVHQPNESVLWTVAAWSGSSLQSKSFEETSLTSAALDGKKQEPEASAEVVDSFAVSAKHQGSPSSSSHDQSPNPTISGGQPLCPEPVSSVKSAVPLLHSLKPGDVTILEFNEAAMELHLRTRQLNLTFTREQLHKNAAAEPCWIRCRLRGKYELFNCGESHNFLDIMSMSPGSEVILEHDTIHADKHLIIAARDEILSVRYCREKEMAHVEEIP
jgi:hypothetical protein